MKTVNALVRLVNDNKLDYIEFNGIKISKTQHYYLNGIDQESPINKVKRQAAKLVPGTEEHDRALFNDDE